jgi:FlaA1/EpsC-like NDP-sugar epimerase
MTSRAVRIVSSAPRSMKRLMMVCADCLMLPLALWLAFGLRYGMLLPPVERFWWLFALAPLVSIPVFVRLGLYRAVIRYLGTQAAAAVLQAVTLSTLVLGVIVLLAGQLGFPRSVIILYWLLSLLSVGGSRFLARALLYRTGRRRAAREAVLIYGAGNAGAQLAGVLASTPAFEPVAMVDDNPALHGSVVRGLRVFPPRDLAELVEQYQVTQVLLAMPTVSRARRRQILAELEPLPVHVKTIPTLDDLLSGRARVDEIREIDIEDLLGRDPVAPNKDLLECCIRGKNVLVTGAGGSIGSELCRQIVRLGPRRLVLLDVSEFALYDIERELRGFVDERQSDVELVPLLGSVQERQRLLAVMRSFGIETVYHAAAYKHVPLVEHNVLEGVCNNVLGTWHAASAAREAGVERFVLISTDKAVRPTNVMGASKRMAELVLQGLAQSGGGTVFCMVRFGNVLGSSGSVVPLFREQIREGGPVTVTHPEITRYFMTIPEAAALVIQAGSMAQGGDVFVLDMGEPVKIVDLARRMIYLTGYQVRDETHPEGDVEIRFTGLRAGEKLYEELLIGDNTAGTPHPRIMRAMESALPTSAIERLLARLEAAADRFDCAEVHALLKEAVQEFSSDGPLMDLLWQMRNAAPEPAVVTYLTHLPGPSKRMASVDDDLS